MKLDQIFRAAVLLGMGALGLCSVAFGQQFPNKPIRLIVPFAAGSGADVLSRVLAQAMQSNLGQPVVVENKTGASGTLAAKEVINSPPDGYTLLVATTNLLVFPSELVPGRTYEPMIDLAPIGRMYVAPLFLAVHSNIPAKTLAEFIHYGKVNPGKLNFGSYGISTTSQFCMDILNQEAKLDITHVPYRGLPILDLVGKRIDIVCDTFPVLNQHVQAGSVRILAVSTARRSALAPEVPTVSEFGFPGYDISTWTALFAPPKTPPAVIAKLSEAIQEALRSAQLKERGTSLGYEPTPSTPEELTTFMRSETERWNKITGATKGSSAGSRK